MKRHRFDPFSALFGAVFVAVGVSFLLGSTISQARRDVWPAAAIVLGCTFVAWAIMSTIHDRRPAVEPALEKSASDGSPREDGPANEGDETS